ncbi:MAG: efflux RND transporter periplasmic adaptor subunit, partial [Candidatus Eremiobacteraeota bacterium]|nr:efflux RND transporter periplasmic adaptor subunit [Candidatus Eremiobacteraeota bacterium]
MKVRGAAVGAAAVAVLGGALFTTGCSGHAKKAAGPPPLAVDVSRARRQDIATSLTLDGQIAPLQESTLSTPESGTVAAVYINEGDRVSAGQLLAKLDSSQLEAQLAANEAAVAQTQAKVNSSTVQAPISSQQYTSAVSQAEQNVQQAQNRVRTAQAALKNTQLVYSSDQSLVSQGYVARTQVEQSRAAYVSAQQELNNAEQALPAAQATLQTARSNTGQTQVDQATIQSNRAAVAEAQANVKLMRTQIAQSSIYAPFNGVVTQRLLDPGSFAGPNQPIVRVSQLSTVYVNANVPDEDLGFVHAGTSATFTSASLPGRTFSGTISDVNATPTTGTLSYRARIRQPNPGEVLRGGMLVTVTVQKEKHRGATVVPRTALFQSGQNSNSDQNSTGSAVSSAGSAVYTVVDGKAKMLPVEVGLETDTLAEVRGAAIRPGTQVITTRPDALQDGSVVAVNG